MKFSLVCVIGIFSTVPFGVALLFFPEQTAALYGIGGWNAGTVHVARLLGVAFLYQGVYMFTIRNSTDVAFQRRLAPALASVCLIGALASIEPLALHAVNIFGWSSIAIYGFLALAWSSVAVRLGRQARSAGA